MSSNVYADIYNLKLRKPLENSEKGILTEDEE